MTHSKGEAEGSLLQELFMKMWAGLREATKSQGSTPELARVGSSYQTQLNGKGKEYLLEPGKTCRLRRKPLTRSCVLT